MRQTLFLSILLTFNSFLAAQELPEFVKEKMDFCDANLTDEQVSQLRTELDALEDYFVRKGLLKDTSGPSYYAVYEQIASKGDLYFQMDTSFMLLDSLEYEVYTGCFYKVLTPEQLFEPTPRHLRAAVRIAENDGNITPGSVAQRIINNLTANDFDLAFFKVGALMTFYRVAFPMSSLGYSLFNANGPNPSVERIELVLDGSDQISINEDTLSLEAAKQRVYQFLLVDPLKKGVAIASTRDASYTSYLDVIDMLHSIYETLNEEFENIPENILYKEPY